MQLSSSVYRHTLDKDPRKFGVGDSMTNSYSQVRLMQLGDSKFKQAKFTQRNKTFSRKKGQQISSFVSQLNPTAELTLIRIENRSLKQENVKLRGDVTKLRKQLQDKVQMLKKFNDLMVVKYNEVKQLRKSNDEKSTRIFQLQLENQGKLSQQQAAKLKSIYIAKCNQYDELIKKINNLQHQSFRNDVYQRKITKIQDQLEEEKTKATSLSIQNFNLTQKLKEMEQKIVVLEYENKKSFVIQKVARQSVELEKIAANMQSSSTRSPTKTQHSSTASSSAHQSAFQEALRVQLKNISQLKSVIQSSQEFIQILKDNLAISKKDIQALKDEITIIEVKATSERKKLIMEYRLQLHEKDNEILSAAQKYKTLQDKYKNALNDIKAKDDFFKQHLLGRLTEKTVQEYVEETLKKYTQNFEHTMELQIANQQLLSKLQKYEKYSKQFDLA